MNWIAYNKEITVAVGIFENIEKTREWIETTQEKQEEWRPIRIRTPEEHCYSVYFKMKELVLFEKRDKVEQIPEDILISIANKKFFKVKKRFKKLFEDNNINWKEQYPKISKSFRFENISLSHCVSQEERLQEQGKYEKELEEYFKNKKICTAPDNK